MPLTQPNRTPAATRVADSAIFAAAKAGIAIEAANNLLAEGFRVTSIQAETSGALPVVWLAFEPRLLNLINREEACYYKTGHDEAGPYRVGYFKRAGAAVKWIERPANGGWSAFHRLSRSH